MLAKALKHLKNQPDTPNYIVCYYKQEEGKTQWSNVAENFNTLWDNPLNFFFGHKFDGTLKDNTTFVLVTNNIEHKFWNLSPGTTSRFASAYY